MQYAQMVIDLQVIADNYKKVKSMLPTKTEIIAILKADAYGLGALPVGKILEEAGCTHFAVTFLEEAIKLRKGGIGGKILVMMPIELDEIRLAYDYKITVSMSDYIHAKIVSDELVKEGLKLPMHIKLDSGLGRMGIVIAPPDSFSLQQIKEMLKLNGFHVEGVYTHITAAGSTEDGKRLDQRELSYFRETVKRVREDGHFVIAHCLSSDPLTYYAIHESDDYVRIGALLLGMNPCRYSKFDVKNSLTLQTKIVQIKTVPKGFPISYGPLYVTDKKTTIAVVPIGFADGLRRALSNVGTMIVHGRKVPIIGKICCDHTILDVTGVEQIKRGDRVTVIGEDGNASQSVGEIAELCAASESEITSAFSSRISRIYQYT